MKGKFMNASRPNPWPRAIIAFFVVFISCTVGLIVFASRQNEDLVRADYYDQELAYQKQIDLVKRTQPIAGDLSVQYDTVAEAVTIALPAGQIGKQSFGKIDLYRTSDARLDREIPIGVDGQGVQRVNTKNLAAGLWKMRIQWGVDGVDYFVEKKLEIRPGKRN